jgi:hypothetical protein
MGYQLNKNTKHKFEFLLIDAFGGGWQKKIYEIIAIHIYPELLEIKTNQAGWHASHTEIIFKKFNITAKIIFDEYDTITIVSDDAKSSIEIIEHWIKIIDEKLDIFSK